MGRAWDTTEVLWTTLRAWVCRCQRLQPIGRSSQRQRVGTCARASRGCSRPRTAQQLPMTIRASERQDASYVQTLSQCNRRPVAELNRRAFPLFDNGTGFRQAFRTDGRSATRATCWRATDSDKAATEDSNDCNRSGTPESRSCEVCNTALTMVAMRTS